MRKTWCERTKERKKTTARDLFTSSSRRPPRPSVYKVKLVSIPVSKNPDTNLRSPCLALALVLGERPLVAESAVSLEFPLLLGDLAGCLVDVGVGESDLCASGLGLEVVALINFLSVSCCL